MNNDLIILIVSSIIWLMILSWIIASSTQSRKKVDYMERQIRLLMLACKKLGATPEEVNAALNNARSETK